MGRQVTAGGAPDGAVARSPADGAEARAGRAGVLAPRVLLPLALLLWLVSLRHVDLGAMGDLGLLQVLPVSFWVSAVLLTVGFTLAVRDRRLGRGWLVGYVLGLVAVVHATPTLLYPSLRYAWAWKHVAVVDAMLRHGGPVPHAGPMDLYNQWPGFFVLNGLVLRATGLHSALSYAAWTPPAANALLLGPLLLLFGTLSRDRTVVWGAVWIYYATSWVGQDYFSPQAFAFLLYMTLLALVFRELPREGGQAGPWGWGARLVLVAVIEAVIVSSHQLTPLMVISVLAVLGLRRRYRRTVLPPLLIAVVLTTVWGATVARPYLSANLGSFVQSLATPDGNVTSNFADLGTAAPAQVIVDWVDRGLSAVVLLLALAALVLRPWVRRTALPFALLSPVPLLAANNYGGEMIFRAYLFSLPFAAFLVAALVLTPGRHGRALVLTPGRHGRALVLTPGRHGPAAGGRGTAAVALGLMLALLGGLFFGYYGKESMNYYTPQEVAAGSRLIEIAPPGSVVVSVTGSVPGIDEDYEDHPEVRLTDTDAQTRKLVVSDPIAGLQAGVGFVRWGTPAYLVLSRAQAAECDITGALPADTVARMSAAATHTPGFTLAYRNSEAEIFRFTVGAAPRVQQSRRGSR